MPLKKISMASGPVALLLVMVTGTAGCVDDDKMFFIRQNQIPDSSCQVSASSTTLFRGHGILDVSVSGYGYYLHPLLENNMFSTSGDKQPERNILHMRRFDIEVDTGELPGSIAQFSFPVSGTLEPGGLLAYAGIEVLRKEDAAALGAGVGVGQEPVITVKLRAIADRSGDTVESSEFIYPITLCNGCLVTMLADCSDTSVSTNPCGLPQDEPVACCAQGCLASGS